MTLQSDTISQEFPNIGLTGATMILGPIPTNGHLEVRISVPIDMLVGLSLLDVTGERITKLRDTQLLTTGRHAFAFDLSGLAAGVYLVSMRTSEGAVIQRLLITR